MISFIVPAHNEEAWIGRCLSAIEGATTSLALEHVVIVVDVASTDATAAIATQRGVRVIQVAVRQISGARNAGAREARGEIIFFVDADTLVNPGVVRSALDSVERGAIGGGCIPTFDGKIPFYFRAAYPFMVFAMRWLLRQTGGACMFCTRHGFDATGGFSEAHFAAEEDVWVKALKRHGRFVVLRETVLTSGRSLRAQSFSTISRLFLRLALRGADGFRNREGLDLWYRPSREKADSPNAPPTR
jgi:glycosyltransferase involved in cell wall biosynthesis